MKFDLRSKNVIKFALIQVLIFSLNVTIYGLSLSILSDTSKSASVASSQFVGDGASLYGIYCGVIVLGVFSLVSHVGLFILSISIQSWTVYFVSLGILNLLFNLISEAIYFKFSSCFNFPSNAIVVARSSMVIILIIFLISISFCILVYSFCSLFRADVSCEQTSFMLLEALLLILPSIVILVLNAVLISRLKPQLSFFIEPSQIKMGFFNSTEIELIKSGTYTKTNTYNEQIIGNLGDIIFSSNNYVAYEVCTEDSNGYSESCTYYYMRTYLHQISCASSNQSLLFYKDCINSISLTIDLSYLDAGPYPSYNCYVNTVNDTCASTCTQLLSSYSLILIQDFNNQVQTAWTGLSNCNSQPNVNLIYDASINPFSNAFKLDV